VDNAFASFPNFCICSRTLRYAALYPLGDGPERSLSQNTGATGEAGSGDANASMAKYWS